MMFRFFISAGILLLTVAAGRLYAQSNSIDENVSFAAEDTLIYAVVEVMPEYSEGREAMYKLIATNIKYPDDARRHGYEGTVYVGFIVTKNGTLRDIRIVKGISTSLDVEAMRVVGLLTLWKPGTQSGKAVNVKFVLPIKFRLSALHTDAVPFDMNSPDAVFTIAEHMPEYPGGEEALKKQIEDDLKSSGVVKVKKSLGYVQIQCIVERDGSLSNLQVIKGINTKYDREAERVVRNLPKLKPGMHSNEPVRVKMIISVEIK